MTCSEYRWVRETDTIEVFPVNERIQVQAKACEHVRLCRLIDAKNERRYDDAIKYAIVASRKALKQAGLDPSDNPEEFAKVDKVRAGVLVGSGMGGLTVFQNGVKTLVEKGHRMISPFFIPYAITNMCAPSCRILLCAMAVALPWCSHPAFPLAACTAMSACFWSSIGACESMTYLLSKSEVGFPGTLDTSIVYQLHLTSIFRYSPMSYSLHICANCALK
jgi:hypothetical protein